MNIKNYTYRKPIRLTANIVENITDIAIHHTGGENDIKTDTDHHIDSNGWSFLGYGYYIDYDGTIYKARGYEHQNAAVYRHNEHIVSIALRGNFDKNEPKLLQLEALAHLIDYLKQVCPIKNVGLHKDWGNTSCPGKNFKLSKLDKYKRNSTENSTNSNELKELKQKLDKLDKLEKDNASLNRKVDRILSSVKRENKKLKDYIDNKLKDDIK